MIFPINTPMFDLLVLAIVKKDDAYGYQISQVVKRVSNTKDSALYPVLKRLQENECLTAYDQQFQGRNRRYYHISEKGSMYCKELKDQWEEYKSIVDEIAGGGPRDE